MGEINDCADGASDGASVGPNDGWCVGVIVGMNDGVSVVVGESVVGTSLGLSMSACVHLHVCMRAHAHA